MKPHVVHYLKKNKKLSKWNIKLLEYILQENTN